MLINCKQGVLQGTEEKSIPSNKSYHSFFGIPFAEPPVNTLRFKAPQPCKSWNGVLDATKSSKICLQRNFISYEYEGEEDCLYLNVHIPEDPKQSKNLKAVMVFIHGGAFSSGSGDTYSAEYLIEYDVILVTINYRLHVLGFLNLGIPECPGNVGLKDMVMALNWIKENIEEFGGNNTNITIFGESAGSAAVSYLMLSPMAKGLFHKAIAQSGHAFHCWSFTTDSLKNAFDLGAFLGYTGNTSNRKELLNFLLKISALDLAKAQQELTKQKSRRTMFSQLVFVPSLEFDIDTSQAFMPESPEILLQKMSPVPLITGLNDLEGLVILGAIQQPQVYLSRLNKISRPYLPDSWFSLPDAMIRKIVDKIKQFYFKGAKICEENFQIFAEMITDMNFYLNFYNIPQIIAQQNPDVPVYIYKFSYEGELNLVKMIFMNVFSECEAKGSCHADELFYLFKMKRTFGMLPCSPDNELKMIHTLCSLWTNFAKYGTPSPSPNTIDWKPFLLHEPCYLKLDIIIEMKKGRICEERLTFWESLIDEVVAYRRSPQLKL